MALSQVPLGLCAMSWVNRHMLRAAGGHWFYPSYGTNMTFIPPHPPYPFILI